VVQFRETNDEAAKQLAAMADEGWEYVGLVNTSVVTRTGVIFPAPVAFKRLKK
jgi:hypothetical protein